VRKLGVNEGLKGVLMEGDVLLRGGKKEIGFDRTGKRSSKVASDEGTMSEIGREGGKGLDWRGGGAATKERKWVSEVIMIQKRGGRIKNSGVGGWEIAILPFGKPERVRNSS